MIDSQQLLEDLSKLLTMLEKDLRQQVIERPDVRARLLEDYEAARKVGRTKDTFETWSEEPVTQGAVAWILGTVYIRFLEDNALVDPMLSGVGARHTRAQQEHQHYFQQHPTHSDRDYLEHLFSRLSEIPATSALFDSRHNPVWRLPLSADGARTLVEFWQRIDPDIGRVAHDFLDEALGTRFLGDLYQDLSEPVRKRYALLQTPRFVASFILDRTLTPAVETFGYREVRLIDPTCGSGHFLLDAFDRLLALSQEHEPGKDVRVLVQNVLSRVVGVDVNPYAAAIATFRLTMAALRACGIGRLVDAPGFSVSVVSADALLHGPRFEDDGAVQMSVLPDDPGNQYYFAEDEPRVKVLLGRQFHAVVGNPPYITVKDAALRDLYRARYGSCSGKYALVVPFMERFFELALPPDGDDVTRAGYVGLIVGNSFMKREFGKKLIEEYLPRWDLTHLVDTSGAYIPGHGIPTAILFGRHRRPQTDTVRAVMGIRGEPSTPNDPAKGLVWTAILDQIDRPYSESAFVSVTDAERTIFHRHPWSIGGGGAAELKALIEDRAETTLGDAVDSIGVMVVPGEDDVYAAPPALWRRVGLKADATRRFGTGDVIRDWSIATEDECLYPHGLGGEYRQISAAEKHLWRYRTNLRRGIYFGQTKEQRGMAWQELAIVVKDKLRSPASIAFSFVATHNHFVFDRGGTVFKQSAPVIKLPPGATEDDHLSLLGLLNSSTACFWLKQVSHNKGSTVDVAGARQRTAPFEDFWEFTSTGLAEFPVVAVSTSWTAVLDKSWQQSASADLAVDHRDAEKFRQRFEAAVSAQEELDWQVYVAYDLADGSTTYGDDVPPLKLGERAFEIVMARQIAAGDLETTWFERHRATPITEVPSHWPEDYRSLVEKRVALIESDRNIGLIEQPEYKRRWNIEPFEDRLKRHQRSWLCDRLESADYWSAVGVTSVAKLADRARQDAEFMRMAEAYTTDSAFDVARVVEELVRDEAVSFLPVLRYKESGLRKREQWQRTWDLQRQEDAGIRVGDVPVPPKYKSTDFQAGPFWRLRGKLDVPKERFVSYPGCERAADGSLPIAWAGWDHAQQARALGAYYMQIKTEEGTVPTKLVPLLAGLLKLLPWIRQWHGGTDPEFGVDLGDSYADFVDTEARALGLTVDQVRAWKPEGKAKKAQKGKKGQQAESAAS